MKNIIQRIIIFILVIILVLPLSTSLAYADGYNGTGGSDSLAGMGNLQ